MYRSLKNNYINKNGFYVIDSDSPSTIDILEGVYAIIFITDNNKPYTLNLEKKSRLDFYGFFNLKSSPKILFNQLLDESLLNVQIMFFCDRIDLKSYIKSYINSNKSSSFINITNIIKENNLFIDSTIEIEEKNIGVEVDLKQKNIFIGEKGTVRGFPTLYVRTNEIKASHSCQIERIKEDLLFYLMSRGISKKLAISSIINSYFTHSFKCLSMLDKNIYENLISKNDN